MLDKYFNYKKHKTDFKTEVIAGVTTFLTMAYIMFLNPFILSGEFAGPEKGFFEFGAVYTATIVATALACFIMAFYGKTWPIGLAPGMGINAFVAFGVCAGMGYTPQEALGALTAGMTTVVFTLLFVDFFDTAGTLTSVANVAGKVDKNGKVQDIEKAMMADSVGTVAGAMMGTTTVTSYVESGAGVESWWKNWNDLSGDWSIIFGLHILCSFSNKFA